MRTAKKQGRAARSRKATEAGAIIDVTVQVATRSRPVPSATEFRRWVRAACRDKAHVTVRLVDSREGARLNREYRGRDYATNVLTFVMNENPPYEGDLALCAPVVRREAREQAKTLKAHYAHLTVHGVLHLQGYDHEADGDAREMERVERQILKALGFADPYLCRAPYAADNSRTHSPRTTRRKQRRESVASRATHGRHAH